MASSVLFDFTDDASAARWRSIDDVVMGGVSESRFVSANGHASFTGTVSLEHGGGFASTRAPEASYDLSSTTGLQLHLRGDGKQYWLTLYTTVGGPISYRASLQPRDRWTTIDVPFTDLDAYRRGDQVPEAPPFAPAEVRSLGFLIAQKQEGPFCLDVAWIRSL